MNLYSDPRHSIATSLRVAAHPVSHSAGYGEIETGTPRFITISRQAGAGGNNLAVQLTDAINKLSPATEPWCVWDKELVSKVAVEHHIPDRFIEKLEDEKHPWFAEFMASLSGTDHPDDFKVYRRVAMTIRALAAAGRAVIVGRGGVFVTAGLSGALHLMLVAPVTTRVQRMADRLQIPLDVAAVKLHTIDHNRHAFYHRYWPGKNISPENFAVTLNTAELSDSQMVAALLPLIIGKTKPQELKPLAGCRTGTEHGGAW
jgi:cytidylate kinase